MVLNCAEHILMKVQYEIRNKKLTPTKETNKFINITNVHLGVVTCCAVMNKTIFKPLFRELLIINNYVLTRFGNKSLLNITNISKKV